MSRFGVDFVPGGSSGFFMNQICLSEVKCLMKDTAVAVDGNSLDQWCPAVMVGLGVCKPVLLEI